MAFAALLQAVNQVSGFKLYRLRAAIDRVLADPKWIIAIRSQLRIGQQIEYFDACAKRLRPAQVREFRTKGMLVRETDTGEHWLIAYTAINLDGVKVSIRDKLQRVLSRHEVAIGDTVGFLDHGHQQRSCQVVRLNDRTVILNADGQKGRVANALLHRALNSSKA